MGGVDRLDQLGDARVGRLAAANDRGDSEVAEDGRQSVARDDGNDGQGHSSGVDRRGAREGPGRVGDGEGSSVGRAAVNSVARRSRSSRACWSRFSTLIRLRLPRVRAKARISSGCSLWTWILTARVVADHDHGLADRLEPAPDLVDVQAQSGSGLDQQHRLEAEALVRASDERRRLGARPSARSPTAARG